MWPSHAKEAERVGWQPNRLQWGPIPVHRPDRNGLGSFFAASAIRSSCLRIKGEGAQGGFAFEVESH